jgi:hypothetical protein
MARVAPVVPDESDLLCEGCGYTLKGLPLEGNCPECGKPIIESVGEHRHPSAFESKPGIASFFSTTVKVLFTPRRFYQTLTSRDASTSARNFSRIHVVLASLLFGFAAIGHLNWLLYTQMGMPSEFSPLVIAEYTLIAAIVGYLLLIGLTKLATWLSAIEAKYWGMRLPHRVVRRGLEFHAVHYIPVGLLAILLVWGYQFLLRQAYIGHTNDTAYLFTLCAAVILCAIYLFGNYWIAMRSMMYANR